LCCVWGSLLLVCGIECLLCVGQFVACLELVSVCCVWDSLERVWGIDFQLCVGELGSGLGERVCAVSERVWCGFWGMSVCSV